MNSFSREKIHYFNSRWWRRYGISFLSTSLLSEEEKFCRSNKIREHPLIPNENITLSEFIHEGNPIFIPEMAESSQSFIESLWRKRPIWWVSKCLKLWTNNDISIIFIGARQRRRASDALAVQVIVENLELEGDVNMQLVPKQENSKMADSNLWNISSCQEKITLEWTFETLPKSKWMSVFFPCGRSCQH